MMNQVPREEGANSNGFGRIKKCKKGSLLHKVSWWYIICQKTGLELIMDGGIHEPGTIMK